MKDKKSCKNCKKALNDDWMYCPYCGTNVT